MLQIPLLVNSCDQRDGLVPRAKGPLHGDIHHAVSIVPADAHLLAHLTEAKTEAWVTLVDEGTGDVAGQTVFCCRRQGLSVPGFGLRRRLYRMASGASCRA